MRSDQKTKKDNMKNMILQDDGTWMPKKLILRRMISQGLDPVRAKARIEDSRAAAKNSDELVAAGWRRNKNGTISPPSRA